MRGQEARPAQLLTLLSRGSLARHSSASGLIGEEKKVGVSGLEWSWRDGWCLSLENLEVLPEEPKGLRPHPPRKLASEPAHFPKTQIPGSGT